MEIKIEGISAGSHYKLSPLPSYLMIEDYHRACPICGSENLTHLYRARVKLSSREGHAIDKDLCKNCGHSFFNKIVTNEQLRDYYKSGWNKSLELKTNTLKVKPNYSEWSALHHIKSLDLDKEAKILDFGCGTGDGLLALKDLGFKNLYGVEIGLARASIAERYFPGRISNGDENGLDELVAKVGKFDLVYTNHVLEHVAQPQRVIAQLDRVLKPGGILAISVPAPGSETMLHSALYYPHLHAYSALSLKKCLENVDREAFQWTGSRYQLAVVGLKENSSGDLSDFVEVKNDPTSAIECFEASAADSKLVFEQIGDRKKGFSINFCHPQTNTRNKKSGLWPLRLFPETFYKISDVILRASAGIFPKFTQVFVLVAYRKFVYRFRIMDGVDTLYLSIVEAQKTESPGKDVITLQSSSPRVFLGK